MTLAPKNPWIRMILVNVALMIALFIYKVFQEYGIGYTHLLVDYHFGFIRRALIGAFLSLLVRAVPHWAVLALGIVVWLATLGLFLKLFRRTYGFDEGQLPLFVFVAGSPLFLKNFIQTIGYFDIYGCLFAVILLLAPARSTVYLLLASVMSLILVLIHQIHFLMYVPTIGVIVMMRYFLVAGFTIANTTLGFICYMGITAAFLLAQFRGAVSVPLEEFTAHLYAKANPDMIPILRPDIWYRTLSDELRDTRSVFVHNAYRFPIYWGAIALHAPLIAFMARATRSLANYWHRRIVLLSIAAVTLGCLIIFGIAFDYARWVANWATCMVLIMFAMRALPTSRPAAPIPADHAGTQILAWIVTAIPRLGTISPF